MKIYILCSIMFSVSATSLITFLTTSKTTKTPTADTTTRTTAITTPTLTTKTTQTAATTPLPSTTTSRTSSSTNSISTATSTTSVSTSTPFSPPGVSSSTMSSGLGLKSSKARRIYIMPCICHKATWFVNKTEDQIIDYLVRETAIQANNTAKNRAKLICHSDLRTSSTVVGLVGAVIIVSVLCVVFMTDVPIFLKHLKGVVTSNYEMLYKGRLKKVKKK